MRRQRGIALITAIILVAIAAVLATAIGFASAMAAKRASTVFGAAQSLLAAEGAEAMAAYVLKQSKPAGRGAFSLDQAWAQTYGPFELTDGVLLEFAQIEDEHGKFNINNLAPNGATDPNALKVFQQLLSVVGAGAKMGRSDRRLDRYGRCAQHARRCRGQCLSVAVSAVPYRQYSSHQHLGIARAAGLWPRPLRQDCAVYHRAAARHIDQRVYGVGPIAGRDEWQDRILIRSGQPRQRAQEQWLLSTAECLPADPLYRSQGVHRLAAAHESYDQPVLSTAFIYYYWHCPVHLVQSVVLRYQREYSSHPSNFWHGMNMAEWLILQVSRNLEEQCAWMLADERGQPLSAPRVGALATAASEAVSRRVAVLVPSGDVAMTDVELPVKGGVKAQQLAPYALEEQLAADVETLHFAVGSRDDVSGRTAVAVVTRELMNQWTAAFALVGLVPEVVCAEAALLPENPGHTIVMLDRDTLSLRRAGHTPMALPAVDIVSALEASLGTDLSNENIIFYATPQDWHRHSTEAEALRPRCASFKAQLLNSGTLPLLAPQLVSGGFINLLGGDFASKRSFGSDWRRWRLAPHWLLALLLVHMAGLSYELVRDKHNERALDDAIGSVARRALPGDSGTGPVRSRIEQRLLAAQSGGGAAGLLPALTAVAQAVSGVNGAAVETLSYRQDGMELRLKTHDAASLDHIDQSLRSNGWQAELTSGSPNGADYEGRIQMHPASTASAAKHAR
jgi:general secretion pathway protein L